MSKSKREAKTIQVFLRIRPPNGTEKERGDRCDVLKVEDDTTVKLGDSSNPYQFHKIFKQDSRQEDVFDAVAKKAVDDAFDGFHGMMFVYGQTGTGKTFTMSNKKKGEEGVLQRAVQMVFDNIDNDRQGDYEVHVTFVQIYREVIEDLLDDDRKKDDKKGLAIRDDPDVEGGVYLSPVKMMPVYSAGDAPKSGIDTALRLFHKGDNNRSVGCTAMNDKSSRSHTVFTLYITRRNKLTEADYNEEESGKKEEFKGRLILVDLAGCERQKKTQATGKALNEANSINSSLLTLGNCIKALTDPRQHVPFRDSKLTRLLQYGLAGHGKTSIIITCGPSEKNLDETRGAVEFGQRAMTIKTHAKRHVEIDYKALCKQLQAQLDARGDTANEQLLEEVKCDYEAAIAHRDEKIQMLEAELAFYRGGGTGTPPVPAASAVAAADRPAGGTSKGGGGAAAAAAAAGGDVSAFREQLERMEEKLDAKGKEMQELKKQKLELQRERNEFKQKLSNKTHDMNFLAMKLQGSLRDKDEQLSRMQAALLKLKRGDYVSPMTEETPDEVDASPRPENMRDDEYINKLQMAIRKMREREALLTSRHEKARDAIMYQANKVEEMKERLQTEIDKRRRAEERGDKYKKRLEEAKA